MDRDCDNCARCGRDGCKSWDCDFIPRKEAVEAWKEKQKENSERIEGLLYAYTLNYKTGKVIERTGTFNGWIWYDDKRWQFIEVSDGNKTGRFLNSLSEHEGVVRGSTIWFSKPNMEGAVEAFKEKARQMGRDYSDKSISAYTREAVTTS